MGTTTEPKRSQYLELVARRKECRACQRLRNPAEVELCEFDSDHIGPWTRMHGDLNAQLMVVGQDWGDVSYYERNKGLDNVNSPTMVTLAKLLRSVGIAAPLNQYGTEPAGLFLTNAVLCLKQGGMQANTQQIWFDNCSSFLRSQIELVAPRVVVTLGKGAYRGVTTAFDLPRMAFRQAVEHPSPVQLSNQTVLVPVYHCGNRILRTHRRYEIQVQDWQRVAALLER